VQGRRYERLLRTTLSASLILAAMVGTVIGEPFDVDINIYPWSTIGKIGIASVTVRYACSSAVIGSNEFLTAAHCLYNDTTKPVRMPDQCEGDGAISASRHVRL